MAGDRAPPAMVPIHNADWARTSGSEAHAMACFRLCGRPLRRPPSESARCAGENAAQEKTMLRKICMLSIAAATLLAWPALAAWPSDRAAQAERIGDQRIIREIVIDGGLTEAGSDDAPANELRPSWVDHRSVLDRPYQHSW